MELTIQDLGAVGELVGGIIVIISVAYLAIQTKQSKGRLTQTRLQRASRR